MRAKIRNYKNESSKSVHSDRLERWLGKERVEYLSRMATKGGCGSNWYGTPINLLDVPGNVRLTGDGDFIGNFDRGYFMTAVDQFAEHLSDIWRRTRHGVPNRALAGVGLASIHEALSRASSGFGQMLNGGQISKIGPTGVAGAASSLWRVGTSPVAGAAGSAAPGGRAPTKATTGAMAFNNPATGTLRLIGADFSSSVINNCVMVYDRIFDVAKTMNSTATEAVTGVPSRFNTSDTSSENYAAGNFLFIEVGATALAATAHNWTTCTYTDQDNNAGATLPSVAGISGAIVDRFDMPLNSWFCPLAAGDFGIRALTQMQCSAAVATGAINFVIGHKIGIMNFPVINSLLPFDWLTSRDLAPYIPNDACVAMFELPKPSTATTTYNGTIYTVSTAS